MQVTSFELLSQSPPRHPGTVQYVGGIAYIGRGTNLNPPLTLHPLLRHCAHGQKRVCCPLLASCRQDSPASIQSCVLSPNLQEKWTALSPPHLLQRHLFLSPLPYNKPPTFYLPSPRLHSHRYYRLGVDLPMNVSRSSSARLVVLFYQPSSVLLLPALAPRLT